jgi:phospholipase/carboxylesterase
MDSLTLSDANLILARGVSPAAMLSSRGRQHMLEHVRILREEGVYRSQLDEAGRMPMSLFLPQAYEPRYPYPLLVFLHGHGEQERQWIDAVPNLSRRNYICIGLRGVRSVVRADGETGYSWGGARRCDAMIEEYVLSAIQETMRVCHVHSERIFLAGFCEGASVAYQLGLSFPDKFAGIVSLNGWVPPGPYAFRQASQEAGPGIFIGHGMQNQRVPMDRAKEAYQLLMAAGLNVTLRLYPSDHTICPMMLRDVDRWVIGECHRRFESPAF